MLFHDAILFFAAAGHHVFDSRAAAPVCRPKELVSSPVHPLAHPWPLDGCPSLAGSPDRTGATQTVRALESEQQQLAVQFLSILTSLPSCPSFAAPTEALRGCLERLLRGNSWARCTLEARWLHMNPFWRTCGIPLAPGCYSCISVLGGRG